MVEKKEWYNQKTTWTAIVGIIGAAAGFFTGVMPAPIAIQTVIGSLLAIFMRQGIESAK